MAGLKAKLETAYKVSGGRKVTLITHSMGGLLVRCFLALYNDVCAYQYIFFFGYLCKMPICCIPANYKHCPITYFDTLQGCIWVSTYILLNDVIFVCFGQIFAKYVKKWISIACPFQGNLIRTNNFFIN